MRYAHGDRYFLKVEVRRIQIKSFARSTASSKALSNLAKVEELEAKIAEEKKKRAELESLQQLARAA